jgi:DNA-binding MarR family transcriptional regulator
MLGGLAVAIEDAVGAGTREAALVALHSHPGRTLAHLSRALRRSHSATVRLVDGLERGGLVRRDRGWDARSTALMLTSAGVSAAESVRRGRAVSLDGLVATLSDGEVRQLEPLLERLLAASAADADARWRTCRLCEESRCEDDQRCPVDRAAPR